MIGDLHELAKLVKLNCELDEITETMRDIQEAVNRIYRGAAMKPPVKEVTEWATRTTE